MAKEQIVEALKKEIEKTVDKINKESEKYNIKRNSRPCELCGSKEFIQLFRNVVGEIHSSMTGYFSILGGSVRGSIDGYTKTLPVLSCKKCNNEREVETWDYETEREWFWGEMHYFYFGIKEDEPEKLKDIDKYFLERPVETRQYMLDNKNWDFDFYNVMPEWDTETWAKAGFDIKPKEKKLLWWKWKVYPSWEQLEKQQLNIKHEKRTM